MINSKNLSKILSIQHFYCLLRPTNSRTKTKMKKS